VGAAEPAAPRRSVRAAALALAAVLALSGLGVGLYRTGHLPGAEPVTRPTPTPATEPPRAPAVLPPGPATAAPSDLSTDALDRLLAGGQLGADPGAYVVDPVTGQVLLDRDSARPRTPASVAKLATGGAALLALGPQARLATRVLAGSGPGEVVLVGGGDATLAAVPATRGYPRPASLRDLAAATADRLRTDGVAGVTLAVDDSLFTGPAVSPDWEAAYVPSGVVAPVHALTVDGGRVRAGQDLRVADPALAAGRLFARQLRAAGVPVTGQVVRAAAPPAGPQLAEVRSPPVAALVELMLTTSDNDLAEALARQVAAARGEQASFAGARSAVAGVLAEHGVDTQGTLLLDGSGLARGSTVSPRALGQLLALAAGGRLPQLRPLVTGLPVAGYSGTLAERFRGGGTGAGAGLVRAKTGTLRGVAALAGLAETAPGRAVVFVVLADRVPPGRPLEARRQLDRVATRLAAALEPKS
jgi:D-alanyl-D-alanine carboxypeptidase/D-alanyl-D-alanine-endopeptidase (penicillin-binding protein 4)